MDVFLGGLLVVNSVVICCERLMLFWYSFKHFLQPRTELFARFLPLELEGESLDEKLVLSGNQMSSTGVTSRFKKN